MWSKLILYLKDFFFPHICLLCKKEFLNSFGLCSICWRKIHFISDLHCLVCGMPFTLPIHRNCICTKCLNKKPYYDYHRSLFVFDKYSKPLIHHFKYNDKLYYAAFFAQLILYKYKDYMSNIDYIIPVPMYKWKRILRGYNQTQILATHIATLSNKTLIPDLLQKIRWTRSQASLTKKNRMKNIKNTIILNQNYDIKNKSILLVDDVTTTGTTINECSKLLRTQSKEIKVITIGMSLDSNRFM